VTGVDVAFCGHDKRRRGIGGDRLQLEPPGRHRRARRPVAPTPSRGASPPGRRCPAARRRTAAARAARFEEERVDEGVAKLATHGAVKNEVDGVVQQSGNVEEVSERPVDVSEEVGNEDAAQREDALRQFGQLEQTDDG